MVTWQDLGQLMPPTPESMRTARGVRHRTPRADLRRLLERVRHLQRSGRRGGPTIWITAARR
jgi:hypothetical protein